MRAGAAVVALAAAGLLGLGSAQATSAASPARTVVPKGSQVRTVAACKAGWSTWVAESNPNGCSVRTSPSKAEVESGLDTPFRAFDFRRVFVTTQKPVTASTPLVSSFTIGRGASVTWTVRQKLGAGKMSGVLYSTVSR